MPLLKGLPKNKDSGCGAIGRVVASNTRDPRFESSHRYNLGICTINYQLKRQK